ncbi:MAG: copper homeostasis protein CutC [Armatimonadetes bacterium]|nr:copper homeostasis protein CutC [Armatimonadota bacterium]
MSRILLEICTGSINDALAAEAGGADRVELNSSLMLGGLTPSLGTLIEAKLLLHIPVACMVRPRSGGFCYTPEEMKVMEADVELMVSHGADGIVLGVLTPKGEVDVARTKRLIESVGDKEVVFHRAFDVVPDPFAALDQLVDLGVTRILTSGQENSAYNGADLIRRLIEFAADRIEILPGGGIDRFNLKDIVARTGCTQVHIAPLASRADTSTESRPHVYFGGELRPPENSFSVVDSNEVRGAVDMLSELHSVCS